MILDRLYKKTKTEATQVCDISVEGDVMKVTFGQLDGAMQVKDTTCLPKNVGRSNETTGEEQAVLEAEAKWKKKIKSGYATEILDENPVQLAMRVKKYGDHLKKIIFPAFISPKLNGVNGEYRLQNSNLTLWTRGGEPLKVVPEHEVPITHIMNKYGVNSINVELYTHGRHLQDITSCVIKHNEYTSELVACIFEFPTYGGSYAQRHKIKERIAEEIAHPNIASITSTVVHSHEEIEEIFDTYVAQGYEGAIIRNARCEYVYNVQSSDAFKKKPVEDAEFIVVDYKVDKNGHPVLSCETNTEKKLTFNVKPKGTAEERVAILHNIENYIGQWYKVEFEMFSKDMKPLKPVGLGLRDCDSEGNPTI